MTSFTHLISYLNAREMYLRKFRQDRQCTYNLALRRVRATIFAVEKK